MELVDTKYNAVLQGQGYRFTQRVGGNLNIIIVKEDEEMWAIAGLTSCIIKVAKKGRDEELYKLGYYKVIHLTKINHYEEETVIF